MLNNTSKVPIFSLTSLPEKVKTGASSLSIMDNV